MKSKYQPVQVANYIIWLAIHQHLKINYVKMMALLYLTQAAYLLEHSGQSLINDDDPFEKWTYLPVIQLVYDHFSIYGSRPLKHPEGYYVIPKVGFDARYVEFSPKQISMADRALIKKVFNSLKNIKVHKLLKLIRSEKLFQEKKRYATMPNQEIYQSFLHHPEYRIWERT